MTSVDVIIPVYNEERALPQTIPRLRDFLSEPAFPYAWRVVIADNASLDATPEVGRRLADERGDVVEYVRIEQKGRGRALRQTWLASPMDIVSYMDVDLSTELEAFPTLIAAVAGGGYDIAVGSRLARGARVTRSFQRTALSRGYNAIIKAMFRTRFSDAQCGFKAMSRPAAQKLLPLTEDVNWFFDTELLIIAEKLGYHIKDVPVAWIEDPDTSVNVSRTVSEDLRGLWRLRRTRPWLSPTAPRRDSD